MEVTLNSKKKKENYISTAKSIGIILMVLGHVGMSDFCIRYIYMFHMPLFFFCSGYFFKEPSSISDLKSYVLRRINRLYMPYVKWSVLFMIFHNMFYQIGLYDRNGFCRYDNIELCNRFLHLVTSMNGHEQLLDPFWFLKQLLLSSILICILSYLLKAISFYHRVIILFLIIVCLTVVCKYYKLGLPIFWDLSIIFLSAVFFLMGHIYRAVERKNLYRCDILFLSIFLLGVVVFIYDKSLDMLWYNSWSVLVYIFSAPLGVFGTICVAFLLEQYPIKKIFYYIGNHTMSILTFHLLSFKLVTFIKIKIDGLSIDHLSDFAVINLNISPKLFLAYSVAGLVLPLAFDFAIEKISGLIEKLRT